VKLNGGLGTTMGLSGPKSTIVVKDKKTFLEIVFDQIRRVNKTYGCSVPLLLMNSFSTEAETMPYVKKAADIEIICFNQNQFPRLHRSTLLPVAKTKEDPTSCWYPPGHGDLYDVLYHSGILKRLASRGIEYLFTSNIDNLGAVLDGKLLTLFASGSSDVQSELTPKLPADVKGGILIRYPNAKGELGYRLMDNAQCPPEHIEEYKSQRKFSMYHTNNIWIRIPFLIRTIETNQLKLDVISNPKVVDGIPVMQLETACGSIVMCSTNVKPVSVPRSRFIPTKSSADLILVMSNYYDLADGHLHVSPKRNFDTLPLISLSSHFVKIKELQARIPVIPDLLELESLTVAGDVSFGAGVSLRGNVVVAAKEGEKIAIPPGSVLDNVTVLGSLQIIPR
jgi:UTP--glucose-1-phosphate uridylyltransferase